MRVQSRGLIFDVRPGTTDEKVVEEVVGRSVYLKGGITINPGDRWLDLGGNIGTFTVLAASLGADVLSVEPEPRNAAQLRKNLANNDLSADVIEAAVTSERSPTASLYLCTSDRNHYRHTLRPTRGRQTIEVPAVTFADLMERHRPVGIKMDIEGAELPILETADFAGVRYLVFEYHFNADRLIANFYKRMERLRRWFPAMDWGRISSTTPRYDYFPDGRIVRCISAPALHEAAD